jgi:hypothetical protein
MAVAALAVAGAACGSGVERARMPGPAAHAQSAPPAAPPAATTAPAVVPDGYRLHEAAGEGFALAVPEAWHDVPFDPAELGRLIEASRPGNPQLAGVLEGFRDGGGGSAKLLVVDERSPGANVNVLKVANSRRLEPGELERARDDLLNPALIGGIDAKLQAAGARDVTREKIGLPAGPALRTTYVLPVTTRDGGAQRVFGVQYYLPAPEALFVLSLSTPDLAAYQADFDKIAGSFGLR